MTRAEWTHELAPAAGDSLADYLVYGRDGGFAGRVFAVLEDEDRHRLVIEREPLPSRHDCRVVPFEAIGEIDHENTAVHLTVGKDAIESAVELDRPASRGPVRAAGLLAVLGLLTLWGLFVIWASSKSPSVLPSLTVPGMLLGAAAFLGFPAWSRR